MTGPLVPLRVRAHLSAGIAQAAPWGIALDGLLASELWAEHKASCRATGRDYVRAMELPEPPDLDLPLARCHHGGGLWHWAATCAHPDTDTGRLDVHTWTGRVDARDLERVATALPKTVSTRQGRYRARRMPLLVTPCSSVTWHAVGDVDRVTELLAPIRSIGKPSTSMSSPLPTSTPTAPLAAPPPTPAWPSLVTSSTAAADGRESDPRTCTPPAKPPSTSPPC